MRYSATTTRTGGRVSSRFGGDSIAVARVIAIGRIPAQAIIDEIEQRLGLTIISQHAVSDWIDQSDPCSSAQQMKAALTKIFDAIESPNEHVVLFMSPFAMSSVIAAMIVQSNLKNKVHIVHYKYQHRDMMCLSSSCLFEG